MPLLSSLSPALCSADAKRRELGAAVWIFSKYCVTGEDDIFIIPRDARDATVITASPQFLNIPNQASVTGKDREQGKNMGATCSLGAAAHDMEKLALIFDTEIKTDSADTNTKYIEFSDSPGKEPAYYQIAIIPVLEGTKLDFRMGWILDYAYAKPENTQFNYDIQSPINVQFSFNTDPHPATGRRGVFLQSEDGTTPVAKLVSAASEFTAQYPQ